MQQQQSSPPAGNISVKNIGGIKQTSVDFTPGVNLLVGRNATNRTSLLQGFMAAMGSHNVTIKGDADEAEVELELGDETYRRQLSRETGNVVTDGRPYLDDAELADLFAFLHESNEIRRAVERSDDLYDLILRPVDTSEIQSEIDQLIDRRKRIERELGEIEQCKRDLPQKEARYQELGEQIEETKTTLKAKEAELNEANDVEQRQREKQKLDEKLEELSTKRADLESVRYELDTERQRRSDLQAELRELQEQRDQLPEAEEEELKSLESEVDHLRERKRRIESEVSELRSVLGFNEDMLEEASSGVFAELTDDLEEGDVTDNLLQTDSSPGVCWTCGSSVDRQQIEATVDQLREFITEKLTEVDDIDAQIEEKQRRRQELKEYREERARIERRSGTVEEEVKRCDENIERLEERRDTLLEAIETVEAEVERLEEPEYSDILEHHREANELEYELDRLEENRESVEGEITDLENRINEESTLKARRSEIGDEIEALRSKIERIERDTVEKFNDHMETVLEILDYDNLDRIWVERQEHEVREGRQTVTKTAFDLHVVRTTESEVAYEDTVDHLSESEREITGLVLALAGYLAHEVYEEVPLILLDSLEAIDSERIAKFIDYLSEYADYLMVVLLPEDAEAVNASYQRINQV